MFEDRHNILVDEVNACYISKYLLTEFSERVYCARKSRDSTQAHNTFFALTKREDEEVEISRFDKLNDRQRQ